MTKRSTILSDHNKRGQTLVAPFNERIGPLHQVSWIQTIMPEVLWIALIQLEHGHRRGVELITSLNRSARAASQKSGTKLFATNSSFSMLSRPDRSRLRDAMAETDELSLILSSLHPLISWYPDCPLSFLSIEQPNATADGLQRLKQTVSSLYRRSDRDPMMVQATVVWLAFDSDLLKVNEGLALAKFPEIEHYPDTALSLRIGSGIRATLNAFFGSELFHSDKYTWPTYFWNRGLAIEPCEFDDV